MVAVIVPPLLHLTVHILYLFGLSCNKLTLELLYPLVHKMIEKSAQTDKYYCEHRSPGHHK